MSDVRDINQIIEAIRRYVAMHPSAADSELGIAEWWLPDFGLEASVEEVREALRRLEAKGVVEMVVINDTRCIWRAV